jgi:hypothetical protein
MSGRAVALLLGAGIIALASANVSTQAPAPNPAMQEKVAALKQALAANQAALKQYTWTESTEISLKGEVKKRQQKLCRYGPDGKVQKTALQGDEPQQEQKQQGGRRSGRVKKAVVENKVDDMKDYMERVAALVKDYVPPDKERIQAAASAGNVSTKPDQAAGVVALAVKDYLKAGDSLAVGLNMTANALSSYDVQSYLDDPKDDVVTLGVQFSRLPDGTSYPQQILLDAAAKKIQVKIVNSGYAKVAQ